MIRQIKILSLIIILLALEINSFSQYYVKIKADSVGFEIDSVILTVDSLPGLYDWEISKDSLTWESLNETNDTLSIRIDDEAYYRAVYYEGTCYPVNSDVALVSFKSIQVTGNSAIIDPTGGVYFLPSGIKLIVPPGAVDENVTVSFDLLDSINADLKIPFDGDTGKVFCTGIYCEPPGVGFLKPVRFNIPAPNYQHTDLPYVYLYDSNSGLWEKHAGDLTCSENSHFIEYTTDKLVSARIHLYEDLFVLGNYKSGYTSKQDITQDCKEGFIHVESEAHDYMGQQGSSECFVNSDNTKVTYLDCPGKPDETAEIQEIGKDCKPVAIDNMDNIECLKNGESATITVTVTIGGKPLKDQEVFFGFIPYGLTINKTSDQTDENGQAQFKITCHIDNFSGEISYNIKYKYFLEVIKASDGVTTESHQNYEQTGTTPPYNHDIKACSKITTVELNGGGNSQLKRSESDQLSCECFDQYGKKIDCGDVVYSYVDGSQFPQSGAVSVSSGGLVTAENPGVALIQAVASGVTSRNNIHYSVAYEGDLVFNGVKDHNIYKNCGCADDFYNPPYEWKWYVVTYSVNLHFYFWLSSHLDRTPWGDLEGTNTFVYDIDADSHCKDTTIVETVNGWDFSYDFSSETSQQIISGDEFYLNFQYWDYRGWGWDQGILLTCKMINPGQINAHVRYYLPEGCVGRVYPEDFILK